MRIGLISDTHGLLRPEALAALQGVDHILHAGDVGREGLLEELEAIAPVNAIRGNVDVQAWCDKLPHTATLELGGLRIHMVHSKNWLSIDPAAKGIDVVVSGHSHRPEMEQIGSTLYINPGAAGKKRFSLPISVALLEVERPPSVRFINLLDDRDLP